MHTPTLSDNIEDWTFDEFLALLLLHAAHADFDYSPEERALILKKVSEEVLLRVEEFHNKYTDGHILRIIMQHYPKYFPTQFSKLLLFQMIKDLFGADGHQSKLESTLLLFLRQIMKVKPS